MRHWEQVRLARNAHSLSGVEYSSEPSSRSRSLLFITLGLALASIDRATLWVPENGFASINPPLGRDRLGSLSTRTTHPAFLAGLQDVLTCVGAHAVLINPFEQQTKGEMFSAAAESIGKPAATRLLSITNSCAHVGHPGPRSSPMLACGVCFGCIMRRASFRAAGLKDASEYVNPNGSADLARWVNRKSIVSSVRTFTRRGVRPVDLLALSLPESLDFRGAMDLCQRGVAELRDYVEA
jgi:hypothetical protein